MGDKKFSGEAAKENDEKLTEREGGLYSRKRDPRSPFARDYTRILHSMAYRRMKHKTQVFFNEAGNDHICTRIEHVAHVESVASTIAQVLGLNFDLTRAIAIGHDIGHAPFGHTGEKILDDIVKTYIYKDSKEERKVFWHEKNGVRFADNIELLEDPDGNFDNMHLTYAVRDGIICHCGEVDQNGLRPREERMDLNMIQKAGEVEACTWEGCVVKMADKIAYLGRDIQDAKTMGYLSDDMLAELNREISKDADHVVNTTNIIQEMIADICDNSSPEKGILLSAEKNEQLKIIKEFNYKYIYGNSRLHPFEEYARLVLGELFKALYSYYGGENTFARLEKNEFDRRPFVRNFAEWLIGYTEITDDMKKDISSGWRDCIEKESAVHLNKRIYGHLETEQIYAQAIIDFLAGMTDVYATKAFEQLLMC